MSNAFDAKRQKQEALSRIARKFETEELLPKQVKRPPKAPENKEVSDKILKMIADELARLEYMEKQSNETQ